MTEATVIRFLKELRRRRVFRVAGLYVVAVWLLMQGADVLFPGWGIPDAAIRYLFWAGLAGFPVALVFGWVFDISAEGIRRTRPLGPAAELRDSLPLRRADYLILSAFLLVIGLIGYDAIDKVIRTPADPELRPSLAEITPNSVAVLPFTSLSGDPEHEYFADGISEEILNRLSDFDELKVIARTSSFSFKDSGYDIARISGLLGVKYLLQGSVRRDGQQLRIAAQLVDHSGVQVWSDSFDRQLGAIFALQEEIADAVAASILPQIVPPRAEERLPDLGAYEAYLTGREILARRETHSADRALAHFDRAIELDPEFPEPYAERAVAQLLQVDVDDDSSAWLDRANRDIVRGLQLKPDLARAHAAQALLMESRDPAGAFAEREALLRRSLALDPNQVDAWNWLYSVLLNQGREGEAEQALGRALRLDPLAPSINANMASREIARGAIAEAEERLLRVLEAPWVSYPVHGALVGLYISTGRLVDAIGIHKKFVLGTIPNSGRSPELFGMMAINALLGRQEQARYWRDRNMELHPDNPVFRLYELTILSAEAVVDYAEALGQVQPLVDSGRLDFARAPREAASVYGELLALGGDHEAALRVLEPLIASPDARFAGENRVRQALAWIYIRSGDLDKSAGVLEPLHHEYRAAYAAGRLREFAPSAGYTSGGLAGFAMTMLLSGDADAALDLLEEAFAAGWRGYYGIRRDPRWDAAREHPRFQAIMAKVKADIDLQRARLEAIEAEDDFAARFDAALALHADQADKVTQ